MQTILHNNNINNQGGKNGNKEVYKESGNEEKEVASRKLPGGTRGATPP